MPFSFSIPRGSSYPPFEVVLKDKSGKAIDLGTPLEAWLVVGEALNTPTEQLTLKLPLDLTATKGGVKHQFVDDETVECDEKIYQGQVKVLIAVGQTLVMPSEPFDFEITGPEEDVP